ncbi:hypothetical protein JOB18_014959 [Solea senegalensis]|uniref:Uncharacterized protein n=1 Tax=Solea senegalensis TaxID=28829 RepID=A0AAV6SQS4_SOLSE|nr:hypothetical protein JOB18_014959 [Solea senegalensis]
MRIQWQDHSPDTVVLSRSITPSWRRLKMGRQGMGSPLTGNPVKMAVEGRSVRPGKVTFVRGKGPEVPGQLLCCTVGVVSFNNFTAGAAVVSWNTLWSRQL